MKRLITKQMRDSFNLSFFCKVSLFEKLPQPRAVSITSRKFKQTEKQRILILRRTVK